MGISQIKWSLLLPDDIDRLKTCDIEYSACYDANNEVVVGGLMDLRMGSYIAGVKCATCGFTYPKCEGHYGCITLVDRLYNTAYMKYVQMLLMARCREPGCHASLVHPNYKAMLESKGRVESLSRKTFMDLMTKTCGACGLRQPKYLCKTKSTFLIQEVEARTKSVRDSGRACVQSEMSIDVVYNQVSRIDPDVRFILEKLGMSLHPDQLFVTKLPVVPPTMRQDSSEVITSASLMSRHDRITQVYARIVKHNTALGNLHAARIINQTQNLQASSVPDLNAHVARHKKVSCRKMQLLCEQTADPAEWEAQRRRMHYRLQREVHDLMYYSKTRDELHNNPASRVMYDVEPSKSGERVLTKRIYGMNMSQNVFSFVGRICGKEGRIRGDIEGSTTTMCARGTVTPDTSIDVDEVGLPMDMAMELSYPELVTRSTLHRLQGYMNNTEKGIYPSAVQVERNGVVMETKDAGLLRFGDVVHRNPIDGDRCVMNRQPTLHIMSMMAFRVRLVRSQTIRVNTVVCKAYNMDFDGDAAALHFPQSLVAIAELVYLSSVLSPSMLLSRKNNALTVAPIQDTLVACYGITSKDEFFTRDECLELLGNMEDMRCVLRFMATTPAILRPRVMYTGKQLMACICIRGLVPGDHIHYRGASTQFDDRLTEDENRNLDHSVLVWGGELIHGQFDANTMSTRHRSFLHILMLDFGIEAFHRCIRSLQLLANGYNRMRGFTIGIGDYRVPANVRDAANACRATIHAKLNETYAQVQDGTIPQEPGLTVRETNERKINGVLNQTVNAVGDVIFKELPASSNLKRIVLAGSKGTVLDIGQALGSLGQSNLAGQRVKNSMDAGRTFPHFERDHAEDHVSRGYIDRSYVQGLDPLGFFIHAMSGREGLVDTAVQTADPGYAQRRAVKALEGCRAMDLDTNQTAIVTASTTLVPGTNTHVPRIIQFEYGANGGGIDPMYIERERWGRYELNSYPCGFRRTIDDIVADLTWGRSPEPGDDNAATAAYENVVRFMDNLEMGDAVRKLIMAYAVRHGRGHGAVFWDRFLKVVEYKFQRSRIEGGTPIGILTAQSIGEPATQMTLNTFHFAGISAKNVTLGFPRLKEIFNVTARISTPMVRIYLTEAYQTKPQAEVENTMVRLLTQLVPVRMEDLGVQVEFEPMRLYMHSDVFNSHGGALCRLRSETKTSMRTKWVPVTCMRIRLQEVKLELRHITHKSLMQRLIALPSRSCLMSQCDVVLHTGPIMIENNMDLEELMMHDVPGEWTLYLYFRDKSMGTGKLPRRTTAHQLFQEQVAALIRQHVVSGLDCISDAKFHSRKCTELATVNEEVPTEWYIDAYVDPHQGMGRSVQSDKHTQMCRVNLRRICNQMALDPDGAVDVSRIYSNDIHAMVGVYGIEVAKKVIEREMATVMEFDGTFVSGANFALMADYICQYGSVLGFQRYAHRKRVYNTALAAASFEEPILHLTSAAVANRTDSISDPTSTTTVGGLIPYGSGYVDIIESDTDALPTHSRKRSASDFGDSSQLFCSKRP